MSNQETVPNIQKIQNSFELEKNLIILSVPTITKLLSFKRIGGDALILYCFYYWNAKRQETNQPKATPRYCQKCLGWGGDRFSKADRLLRELGLIEKIPSKDKKGKIIGWYVKINYIWTTKKERKINPEPLKSRGVENPPSGKRSTNALSVNNINALSVNNNQQEFLFYPQQAVDKTENKNFSRLKSMEKPSVENPPTENLSTENLSSIEDIINQQYFKKTRGGVYHKWQDKAVWMWKNLGLSNKPSASWFKLFKKAHEAEISYLLDLTFSSIIDANIENPEKYFYKIFHSKLMEIKPK